MNREGFMTAYYDGQRDFSRTDFRWADLTLADFRKADLTEADFRWADLTDADFTGAILDGAVGCRTTLSTRWR